MSRVRWVPMFPEVVGCCAWSVLVGGVMVVVVVAAGSGPAFLYVRGGRLVVWQAFSTVLGCVDSAAHVAGLQRSRRTSRRAAASMILCCEFYYFF